MNSLNRLLTLIMTLVLAAASIAGDSPYPNELPGYEFHATAKWASLRPLISTSADVVALLGHPDPVFFDAGPRWKYIIYYWGKGGSCNGRPYPSSLVGRVASIELVPKVRVSFSNVRIPSEFHKTEEQGAHDPVGSWEVYKNLYGLEYQVYAESSADGSIHAGDLKAIVYGPSRRLRLELTRCPEVGEE